MAPYEPLDPAHLVRLGCRQYAWLGRVGIDMLRLGLRKPGIEKRVRDGGEFDATCWLDIVQGKAQQFRGYFL